MPTYTVKQQQTLEIVRDMLIDRGLAPTLEEIGNKMGGISRVAVLDHLRALERKGAISISVTLPGLNPCFFTHLDTDSISFGRFPRLAGNFIWDR